MEFYTPNGRRRPVRLSEATRLFALESLGRKYGLDTLKTPAVTVDYFDNFATLESIEQYDIAIKKIALDSPIRICNGERISGAATLGMAIQHLIPATYREKPICESISHLTVDFETVLKSGINSIKSKAVVAYDKYKNTEKETFALSCLNCISAFEVWHTRYLNALSTLPEYKANYENLKRVPMEPATNFYEAVQSLWFTFAFIRLCGNWPGIGRIDYLLGDYLKKRSCKRYSDT